MLKRHVEHNVMEEAGNAEAPCRTNVMEDTGNAEAP